MNRIMNLIVWLLLLVTLSGCAVFKFVTSDDQGRNSQTQVMNDSGVVVTIWTDHYCYKDQEPILVRLAFENTSDNLIILDGVDKPSADIVLYSDTDEILWSETEGQVDKISLVEIEAGKTYQIEWSVTPPDYINYHIKGVWTLAGNENQIMAPFSGSPDCPGFR